MKLSYLKIKNHPILKDIQLDFRNPKTNQPYSLIAFVGENGCGKTTLLNEIFNYAKSEYIYDKEENYSLNEKDFEVLFLRQGSAHINAMKEVRTLIDGTDMYPVISTNYIGSFNVFSLRDNNHANSINLGAEILNVLGDSTISELFKSGEIDDVWCSNSVSEKIDGVKHGLDITKYSSGQQEILLKIKDIRKKTVGTDCVLLDEPETSLHPRWQKEIVGVIKSLLKDVNGNVPQIFITTHSEKVLESLLNKEDTLIIGLERVKDKINATSINKMNLYLPNITYDEIDYVIFNIESYTYHNQLFAHFGSLYGKDKPSDIDHRIEKNCTKIFGENINQYIKELKYIDRKKEFSSKTLPTYIRNYFNHPKGKVPPTDDELANSIKLLQLLILEKTKK